jgi:hypothetical protein
MIKYWKFLAMHFGSPIPNGDFPELDVNSIFLSVSGIVSIITECNAKYDAEIFN